jgi:hypothetical protein
MLDGPPRRLVGMVPQLDKCLIENEPPARARDWFDSEVGQPAPGVDELVSRGWARLEGYLGPAGRASLAKPAGLAWRPLAPGVGAVTQSGWFAEVPIEEVPGPVRAFGSVIHGLVEQSVDVCWRHEPH